MATKYSIRCNLMPNPRKDGTHTIRMRVSWNSKRISHCLVASVLQVDWDERTGLPRRTQKKALKEIESLKVSIDNLFDLCHIEQRIPEENEIRKALGEKVEEEEIKEDMLLTDVLRKLANDSTIGGGWELNTRQHFTSIINDIEKWNPTQTIGTFDKNAMQLYMDYLFERGMKNSTVMNYIQLLRCAAFNAAKLGLCKQTDATTFRPKYNRKSENEVVYLEEEELQRLIELDLTEIPYLDHVRDIFVFCCFTGLRYSDVKKLRKLDIHDNCISVVTQKTFNSLTIELNTMSRKILDKYKYIEGDKALPVTTMVNVNVMIKTIGKMAKIDAPVKRVWYERNKRCEAYFPKHEVLSTHCGRKTFVVTALSLDIASEVIMKWTGHKTHETMRPYVAIVQKKKKEQMSKFDSFAGGLTKSLDRNLTTNMNQNDHKQVIEES